MSRATGAEVWAEVWGGEAEVRTLESWKAPKMREAGKGLPAAAHGTLCEHARLASEVRDVTPRPWRAASSPVQAEAALHAGVSTFRRLQAQGMRDGNTSFDGDVSYHEDASNYSVASLNGDALPPYWLRREVA